jgi:hypothetical protein
MCKWLDGPRKIGAPKMNRFASLIFVLTAAQCLAEQLTARFEHLACAVVQVHSAKETGTPFFVDKNGTLATVAHVLYDKKFHIRGNDVLVDLTAKADLTITMRDGKTVPLNVPACAQNGPKQL